MVAVENTPSRTQASERRGSRRVRVTHLVSTLNIGGLEKVVYDLTRLADRERFDVQVVCLGEVGALGPSFAEAGVPVTALNVHGQGVAYSVRVLLAHLRANSPDVLHTHNPAPHVAGALAGRIVGIPVVVHTKHGRNFPGNIKKVWANRIASWFTRRIIAVSADAANVARQIEHVPPQKVEPLFNGIDLERFHYAESSLNREVYRAIHVARLDFPKDLVTLLRAVRIVANSAPKFHLDIVGDGPQRAKLEALCDELRLRDHLTFHGFRDDVNRML